MTPLVSYRDFIKNAKNKERARQILKERILKKEYNISEAARCLQCTTKTIRKLLNSDDLDYEKKKAPKNHPNQISKYLEDQIIKYRLETGYGPDMLKVNMGLSNSTSTIYRVLKDNNLLTKKRAWRKKKEVRRIRKKLRAFEKWQLDTKYLTDIPNLIGGIKQGTIPKYEYTLRDMVTGTTFLGYGSKERSVLGSCTFVGLCLYHMQLHGIDTHYVRIQADNGPEIIGGIGKKTEYVISKIVERQFHGKFNTIPIRSPRFNSHVETFHKRVERELYDRIKIEDSNSFFTKAREFTINWNTIRKNLKDKKTCSQIAKQRGVFIQDCFYDFPILVYDTIENLSLSTRYYVPDDSNSWSQQMANSG